MAYPLFHPRNARAHPLVMEPAEFDAEFPAENPYVERKTGIGSTPIQEAVVAFSNSDGGIVLIGVSDDGAVAGRELNPGTEDDLHRILGDTHDPGRYSIEQILVGSRPIVVLAIAERQEGFAQTSQGRVMVRRGTRKVALFGTDLREFINARTLRRFEDTPLGVGIEAAPRELLQRVRVAYGWAETDAVTDRLSERGLLTSDGSRQMTVAGALHLLDDPAPTLGKAYIEILRYPDGQQEYDRREEIRGPIARQIERAAASIADELGNELVVVGLTRHELPRLPMVVLREALANAVAHRSYELSGACIRVERHADCLRIISPGGLPEPVTVDNLRETQAARNLHAIDVLRRLGLAEDAGRGIDVMEDVMQIEMLEPPRFEDSGHSVTVTLPIRTAVAPAERAWIREVEARGAIEPADRTVLVHAARGEALTNSRVRELLNVDQFVARQSLRRLRDAGLLDQHGQRGGVTYTLKDTLNPPAGLRLKREDLKRLIVEMATQGELDNAQVRDRTGLDRADALRLLSELVAEGLLTRTGERRGTRYTASARS